MIYGRIIWVGEWSGPFIALPQRIGFHCVWDIETNYYLYQNGKIVTAEGPMPIQPKIEARFVIGVHDGFKETKHTLNSDDKNRLLRAIFGDFTSQNRPNEENCVGFYIQAERVHAERVHDKEAKSKKARRLRYDFAVISAPSSSWAA